MPLPDVGRLAGFSGAEVGRVAESCGWRPVRVRGSHEIYSRPGGGHLSIPLHRELREGLVRSLIADMGLTVDEFLARARK